VDLFVGRALIEARTEEAIRENSGCAPCKHTIRRGRSSATVYGFGAALLESLKYDETGKSADDQPQRLLSLPLLNMPDGRYGNRQPRGPLRLMARRPRCGRN
jgi:hypothetical protein